MAAVGCVAIATLPAPPGLRGFLTIFWIFQALTELARLRRVYRASHGYRLYADGAIEVIVDAGIRLDARVAAGTVILPGLAWLRVDPRSGRKWGELVRGDGRESKQWRRFQVIFRHLNTC